MFYLLFCVCPNYSFLHILQYQFYFQFAPKVVLKTFMFLNSGNGDFYFGHSFLFNYIIITGECGLDYF